MLDYGILIAVIADIHGNVPALEAVLSDVDALGVAEIIVNGDLVNRGPSSAAVVEMIFNHPKVRTVILGNHDDLMCKWVRRDADIPEFWFKDAFWRGMAWCADNLEKADKIAPLRTLPMTHRLEPPNLPSVLVSHGSPRHYREGYGRHLSRASFSELTEIYPADIYIGSHTHRPYESCLGRHLMLNTGAVGAPFNGDPRAQYLLLHADAQGWHYQFRAVPYNRTAALAAFETSGYLSEGGLSARIFYEELRLARPLYMLFWEWSESETRPKDWESWDVFKKVYRERFQAAE